MNSFWAQAETEWKAMREPDKTINLGLKFGCTPRYVGPSKPVIPDPDILAAWKTHQNVGLAASELDTSVLKVKQSLRRQGVAFKFHVTPRPTAPSTWRCQSCLRIGEAPTCPHCGAEISPLLLKSEAIARGTL